MWMRKLDVTWEELGGAEKTTMISRLTFEIVVIEPLEIDRKARMSHIGSIFCYLIPHWRLYPNVTHFLRKWIADESQSNSVLSFVSTRQSDSVTCS